MPVLLSLETSTDVCSVALQDHSRVLGEIALHEPQVHASKLAPLIQTLVAQSGLSLKNIDAVAVSKGPGSYTGLRIGISTAKGLCYALDVPLISIGTLELLAYQGQALNSQGGLLCPMIDARRMEVYSLIAHADLTIVEPVSARVVNDRSFAELLDNNRMLFFGSGAAKCRGVITHPNASFIDGVFPSATVLGKMAQQMFESGKFEDLVQFKPFYLKAFVAKKAGAGS